MIKSFAALLAENDEQFVYWIKSIYNIHNEETMDQIRLALTGFRFIDLERDFYRPLSKENNDFPNIPNSPTYALKATIGFNVDNNVLCQKISQFARIKNKWIIVHKNGEDPHEEPKQDKSEYKPLADVDPSFDSTTDDNSVNFINPDELVGTKRIGAFVKELEKERIERKKELDKKQYSMRESKFATTHLTASSILGRNLKKGYYVVESEIIDDKGDNIMVSVTGPLSEAPFNFPFHSHAKISSGDAKLTETKHESGLVSHSFICESQFYHGDISNNTDDAKFTAQEMSRKKIPFEVVIKDKDTGLTYKIVVSAFDENGARNKGVRQIADKLRVQFTDRFIVLKPEKKV